MHTPWKLLAEGDNGKLYPIVVLYTKKKSSYGDRFLPLGEYELDILKKTKRIKFPSLKSISIFLRTQIHKKKKT
jgi:hypothetical protein